MTSPPNPMSPTQAQEQRLLEAALALGTEPERRAFLAAIADPAARQRLEELVAASVEADSFFGAPLIQNAGVELVEPKKSSSPPAEAPAQMLGRYKLLEKIGEGGFGEVWMAEQREPVKRRVALKIIKLGMDSRQIVARFEAERQALAMMDHPNIAKIFDAGTTENPHPASGHPLPSDGRGAGGEGVLPSQIENRKSEISQGRPYFVMELVRGIKITEYCDQNQLTTQERLDLFIKVCQAIQHAHQKGIIHRDIKPSNILVTVNDGVPVPKVIDFGIAKATQGELTDKTVFTQFQQFIGTPAYISPEQAEMSSLDIDTRADIYSLGVLLYELLVGQTPFDAKEMMQGGLDALRQIIREREPQRPSTKLNTLPGDARTTAGKHRQTDAGQLAHQLQGDLDWIVMKCLEKDRTRRYETANGLAADLQRHLANEPVVARPPSMAYKIQKAWQRNKLAFSAAAAVALALLVGSTVSTWQAVVATRATRAETEQRLAAQKAEALAVTAEALAVANEKEAITHQQRAELSEANTAALLYGANINLAQANFEQANIPQTRRLLEQTRSHADRGFEWYYWQRQLHRETRILRGHAGHVERVAFSPDGRRILTQGEDQMIIIRDAASGEEQLRVKAGQFLQFSPDGERLLCSFNRDGLQIRSAWTGAELTSTDLVRFGTFTPDGKQFATVRGERAVFRDAATGRELSSFKAFSPYAQLFANPIVFSPDGRWMLAAHSQLHKGVALHDAVTGEIAKIFATDAYIQAGAFSPDGRRIVTWKRWGENGEPAIWDIDQPDRPLARLPGLNGASAVFSPDGKQIVTMNNLKVRTWDADSGQHLRTKIYTKTSGFHTVPPVGFTPDGRLYCASIEELTIWDPVTGEEVFHLPMENAETQNAFHPTIAFSPDGRQFALTCLNWKGAIQIHEAASGRLLGKLQGHRELVTSLEFSPDGARLLSGSIDETAKIWDWRSGRELLSFKAPVVITARFTPDGRMIFAAGPFKEGLLWEAATPEQVTAWEAEDAAGTTQWAAMTEEFYRRRKAGWAADGEAGEAVRAAFVKATEDKLARLGDPALLGKLPGAIRQWLALSAPYNYQPQEIQLDDEQIANEAQLRPRANEIATIHTEQRAWTALQLEDYRLDFRTAIKSGDADTVAYAVSYILSERDQTGLVLKVGSDYHAKLYLNQREIHHRVNPATAEPDRDAVTGVELKAGLNVLVFKVVRSWMYGDRPWSGSVRFTNADGSPAQGLTVTLDPDAKQ